MKKFLGISANPFENWDFSDKKRWGTDNGSVYKLLKPDIEKDLCYSYAHIKSVDVSSSDNKVYIEGMANANIFDRMQERLDPVGLNVVDYLKNPMLLAHHNYYHPVGQVEVIDVQDDGVHFLAWIGAPKKASLTRMQEEIRSLVQQGILKTVSVGFIPKKVKAPTYNESGDVIEPLIIEAWDLLELSLVAVPCNQDSIFQVRSRKNAKKYATISDKSSKPDENLDLIKVSTEIQSLIFSKEKFSRDKAIKWAKDHDFRADKVDETQDSYRLRQKEPSEFEDNSFRTIMITDGVQAVIGKLKKDQPVDPNVPADPNAPSDQPDPQDAEMLMLMRGMADKIDRVMALLDQIASKLDAKPSDQQPVAKPKKDSEDDVKHVKMDQRLEKLEKSFEKLVSSVSMIVNKLPR